MKYVWYIDIKKFKELLQEDEPDTTALADCIKIRERDYNEKPIVRFKIEDDVHVHDLSFKKDIGPYEELFVYRKDKDEIFRELLMLYFYKSHIDMDVNLFDASDIDDLEHQTGKFAMMNESLLSDVTKLKLQQFVELNKHKPAYKTRKFSLIKDLKKQNRVALTYYFINYYARSIEDYEYATSDSKKHPYEDTIKFKPFTYHYLPKNLYKEEEEYNEFDSAVNYFKKQLWYRNYQMQQFNEIYSYTDKYITDMIDKEREYRRYKRWKISKMIEHNFIHYDTDAAADERKRTMELQNKLDKMTESYNRNISQIQTQLQKMQKSVSGLSDEF